MGNQLVWEDRFNIGVKFIDKEHQKLFGIVNKLFTYAEHEDKRPWVCQEGIKYFKDHAMKHFAEEEAYMASISYEGFETHKRLHEDFRLWTIPALEKELQRSRYSKEAIDHFMGVCAGWLIGHTLTEDQAIAGGKVSKWTNLLPADEQMAVKQVILRLLESMFQLEARLVTECYGGEKFGKGIYYRLTYDSDQGRQRDVVLIFEEKLLLETVGKIMGEQSNKLSVTVMNAVRYTARQFVECIIEQFPSEECYKLQSENLLTYEQFEKMFERQLPQHSLLFNTGVGYFAYCSMTPHMARKKEGVTIQADNAVKEVSKYLQKTAQEKKIRKKKVLVVDDSETIRQLLKGLLQNDYQVTLAQSGVSAIRCLVLERPDLVLLDYNMPDCDGGQLLKMIRSEIGMADVPVIFLSGTVDKERLSKLIALKPAGYLLKSMPHEEIKKNIDDFFIKKDGSLHKASNEESGMEGN
ncbi:hemerythrin domain-containing protein [Lachnospiraceae bacterium JLR.KK008]